MIAPSRLACLALVVLGVLVTASCGSTLPPSAGDQIASNQQLVPNGSAPTGTAAPVVSAGRGSAGGTSAAGSAALPSAAPGTAGEPGGIGSGTLDIGVYTAQGATAFYGSLGVEGLNYGNMVNQVNAVVNYINSHGGAGGRKLRVVFHDFDIAKASTDPAAETQAACADWTEDRKVYAVIDPIANAYMDQLVSCLAKHGIPVFNNSAFVDERFMKRHSNFFYSPSGINFTRSLRHNIDVLHKRNFFTKGAPVGVVRYNTPEDEGVVADGVLSALKARGLKAEVSVVDVRGTGNEYQNMVLRFKTIGVKEVIFTWTSPYLFAAAASAQGYKAKFALTTHNALQFLQTNVSSQQLDGASGMSWSPGDMDDARYPGPVSNRHKLCAEIFRKAGEGSERTTIDGATNFFCDPFLFFKDVMDRTKGLSPQDLAGAVESFGPSYESAIVYRTKFGSNRTHDGVDGYRVFVYKADCRCFTYVTGEQGMS